MFSPLFVVFVVPVFPIGNLVALAKEDIEFLLPLDQIQQPEGLPAEGTVLLLLQPVA